MNNTLLTETSIPQCFQCLGPYYVDDKNEQRIGELRPHCYIGHNCWCCLFHPLCMSLDVYDKNMNKIYVINREPWTFICCTKWYVSDLSSQVKSEITHNGFFCPNFHVSLPKDTEDNKKLVLSAIGFLP